MPRTPESSPERGSIGGIPLLEKGLPYRLKAFPPSYSPDSSPDRGSGGVSLPAVVEPPSKLDGARTADDGSQSSPEHDLQSSVGNDGPSVSAPQSELDARGSSITHSSPAPNTGLDKNRIVPSSEGSIEQPPTSGDGVGDDAFPVSASPYTLDDAESRNARLPPTKLSPHYFPDSSRSVSNPQRSLERSAISGDGADSSLRPSRQDFQENQPPIVVHEHLLSNPPAYQARPLARRQRRRNRFQYIVPSHSRRRSVYRQLKVRLYHRLIVPIITVWQECIFTENHLVRRTILTQRPA